MIAVFKFSLMIVTFLLTGFFSHRYEERPFIYGAGILVSLIFAVATVYSFYTDLYGREILDSNYNGNSYAALPAFSVTDSATGLKWQKNDDNVARNKLMSQEYCLSQGMRLPTFSEMQTLTQAKSASNIFRRIKTRSFVEIENENYWISDIVGARAVTFDFGSGKSMLAQRSEMAATKCVSN